MAQERHSRQASGPAGKTDPAVNWLISSKLSPPQDHVTIVDRPELVELLDRGRERRLTLLQASAGYGKTTLAGQWRQRLLLAGRHVAWLTLDEEEREPRRFLSYLITTLHCSGINMDDLARAAEKVLKEVPLNSAVAALVSKLASHDERVIIMLDDYHRVDCVAINNIMDGLLAHLPSTVHLLIASRERPGFPLAELRLRGELHEFLAQDLRFSISHARKLLPSNLVHDEVSLLNSHTEGWPAALQLSRMWLAENFDRRRQIGHFSGATTEIAEYLAEQVFTDMPLPLQDFLLKTSILDRITGELADRLCGEGDSWMKLDTLSRSCSFLLPVDIERHWYRYHHLFADFLQQRLTRSNIDVPSLHLCASEWYADQGLLPEAVRHARLAGDLDLAAGIIFNAGGWELVYMEGAPVVSNLLHNFGQDIVRYPRLQLCEVYTLIKNGDLAGARQLFEALDAATCGFSQDSGGKPETLYRDAMIIKLVLDGYSDRIVTESYQQLADELVEKLPPGDHGAMAGIWCTRCLLLVTDGRFSELENAALSAAGEMRRAGSELGLIYAKFHHGLSLLFRGDLPRAGDAFESGLEIAVQLVGTDSGLRAIADVLLAEVDLARNDLYSAADRLHGSLLYIEDYDGWHDIYVSGYRTGLALAGSEQDADMVEAMYERTLVTARKRELNRLKNVATSLYTRALLRCGQDTLARSKLKTFHWDLEPGRWRRYRTQWREECEYNMTVTEVAILDGRPAQAAQYIGETIACCKSLNAVYLLVPALILRALVYNLKGDRDAALTDLKRALRLASTGNYRRPFLDSPGSLLDITGSLLEQALHEDDCAEWAPFAAELLSSHGGGDKEARRRRLSTVFTEREMAVVLQLGQGYSNKIIARALNISENTVKFHLKNIYAKLGVHRRNQAIELAKNRFLIH